MSSLEDTGARDSAVDHAVYLERTATFSGSGVMGKYKALMASIKSVYGKRFFHRLGMAFRSGWACLLAGLLLEYGSPVNQWMAIPFFSLVICLNAVESNVGAVLWNIVGVLVGMAQAITIGLVVLLTVDTKLSLPVTIICIFVASFCVAYQDGTREIARKVALSQIGIIFITAHSGQNDQSVFFLVRLIATTLLGASCAMLAVLVPAPGLACWEARDSARSAVMGTSELLKSVVEAFCARDVSTFSSISLHAKFLASTISTSLSELNSRRVHAIWELRGFGLIPAFKRMAKGLNGLQVHLLGMSLALQSSTVLPIPDVMSATLRDSLKSTGDKCKCILELTTKLSNSNIVLLEKQKLLEEAKIEFQLLDQNIMVAREETYYTERAKEQSLDELLERPNPQGYTENETIRQLLRTMVPTYFFLFNLRMFFAETMNMIDSGKIANKMHQKGTSAYQMRNLEQSVQTAHPKQAVSDQACQPRSPSYTEIDSACPSNMSTACHCQYRQPSVTRWESCLKWFEGHGLKIDNAHSARALKISLAMSMAALGGIRFNVKYAFWANISVGFIIQNHQGGSFRMASLRLQGTVIGATYGYLAILITHNYRYMVLISLIPWVVLLSYLRFSNIFGPAGVIAGLTAAIVMLGDGIQPIQDFAFVRITENFIGVLCLVVVETVVWPNRAVTLLRKELVSSLTDLRDCVAAVIAAYKGNYCPKHRRLVVQEIKKLEQQLTTRFAKQVDLQSEAVMEPVLWNVPFPTDIYFMLVQIQGHMLDLLYFMVHSLNAATKDCSEQVEKLVGPLQTSLAALEAEVLSSLDILQGVLQVNEQKIAHLSKNLSWENDKENQLGRVQGSSVGNLQEMVSHVHPLLVLECRQRAIDGTPLSMKSTMEAFEANYEEVVSGFIAAKRANPAGPLLSNSAMLSFSAVTFSLKSLLRETVELEKAVHELLHFENPWSILDFWGTIHQ